MIDDLDRILADEPELAPSQGFAPLVMDAVREAHGRMVAIPFPWRRFVAGLAGGLICVLLSAALLLAERLSSHALFGAATWVQAWSRSGAANVLCLVIVVIGSLLVVRLSVEFTSE